MRDKKLNCLLFLIVWIGLIFFHQRHFDGATPVSRLDAMHAIVHDHSLAIDAWRTNTPDLAFARGHYYSDKAPGTLILALPGFLFGMCILHVFGTDIENPEGWLLTSWTACGGIAFLVAFALFRLADLLSRFSDARAAWFTAVTIWFGAAPLPYSTWLYSHSHVVACIALGLHDLVLGCPSAFGLTALRPSTLEQRKLFVRAGMWLGIALSSEFTAGIVVCACIVFAARSNLRSYFALSVGGIIPFLSVPAYSWMTIGSPFSLPYSFQARFPEMKEGLYAIKLPNFEVFLDLIFGNQRGLLYWTPFFLISLLGYHLLAKKNVIILALVYVIPLVNIFVISGRIWDWQAGPCFGPRYLAPILPLLAIPCSVAWRKYPYIAWILAIYSLLITGIATATTLYLNYTFEEPMVDPHFLRLIEGRFSNMLPQSFSKLSSYGCLLFYGGLLSSIFFLGSIRARRLSEGR